MFSLSPKTSRCCWAILLTALVSRPVQGQQAVPDPKVSPAAPTAVTDNSLSTWSPLGWDMLSPNMYGDIVGIRPLFVSSFVPGTPGSSRQISGSIIFSNDGVIANAIYRANLDPQPASAILTRFSLGTFTLNGKPIAAVPTFTATATVPNTDPFPATVGLLENSTITQDIRTQFANAGENAVFNSASRATQLLRNLYNIFLVYDLVIPGIPSQSVFLAMPNPVDGALVGRTKISTDNNPLPRDRFIFDYDYLNQTPLSPGGMDMHRYCFGVEKTFFDGMASIELRLPFASTVDTLATQGGITGSSTQFGNLHLTLKTLAYSTDFFAISGGLGISVPTASDTRLQVNNVDLVRINNETVLLTPFVAILATPTERSFGQFWAQYGFDPTGNPVQALGAAGLEQIGRLNDPQLLQLDCQFGYWMIHPATTSSGLRGLAPFLELHYNTTTSAKDHVSRGALTIVDALGHYHELNLSAAVTAQLMDNIFLTGGVTAPLMQGNNRFGDYQIGMRLNWFYGRTANARRAAISNF